MVLRHMYILRSCDHTRVADGQHVCGGHRYKLQGGAWVGGERLGWRKMGTWVTVREEVELKEELAR